MNCQEAAGFISALYDSETIPRGAAEHIGACEACQEQMKDYLEIGIELRRVASLALAEEPPPLRLDPQKPKFMNVWKKGWGTMRIPRLAFAALVAGVAVLGSSLVVVGVGAHGQGSVILLKIALPSGESSVCPLSAVEKKDADCSLISAVDGGTLQFGVNLLSVNGDHVELGVRTKFIPTAPEQRISSDGIRNLPIAQYAFEPGKTLQVKVDGVGTMTLTAEWTDHVPALLVGGNQLDPGPGELRFASPTLLLDKQVVGDLEAGASTSQPDEEITVYYPGQGRFEFSLKPLPGAVRAEVKVSRVTFELDGSAYSLLTGAPVTRADHLWVRRDTSRQPPADFPNQASISGGLIPRVATLTPGSAIER